MLLRPVINYTRDMREAALDAAKGACASVLRQVIRELTKSFSAYVADPNPGSLRQRRGHISVVHGATVRALLKS
jgi:hypothetical protein